jgi:hypothetical protein
VPVADVVAAVDRLAPPVPVGAGLRGLNAVTGLRGLNAVTGLRGPNAVTGLRGPNPVTSR